MAWRTDMKTAGSSSVLSDLGVHAHHLMRFITGFEVTQDCAILPRWFRGTLSDGNAQVLLNLTDGARGSLWASFIAAGNRQDLQLRVFGSSGSLTWTQEEPGYFYIHPQNAPRYVLRRGEAWLSEEAAAATQLEAGQLEAFANTYANAATLIRAVE